MSADYGSTARALALPVSPPRSPNTTHQPIRTSWSRSQSNFTPARGQSPHGTKQTSFVARATETSQKLGRQAFQSAKKLSPLQRTLAVTAGVLLFVVTILFFVFNERILRWLEPLAENWKNLKGGWLILWFMTFTVAFPPLIGYATCVTIAGFVYGFPNG